MKKVNVVQLAKVINDGFPIAIKVHRLVLDQSHLVEPIGRQDVVQGTKKILERHGLIGKAYKDESVPAFGMHFFQGAFFTGCTGSESFLVRDDRQIAIDVITPCVVSAAKVNSMAAFLGD